MRRPLHAPGDQVVGPEGRTTVLVIDDSEADRDAVRRLLGDAYRVVDASTADSGVEACARETPALVLIEYGLPDLDGISVLPELAALGCPVILLTSQGDEEIAVAAMKAGASDYLVKDRLDPDTLRRATQHAIREHSLRSEVEEARSAAARSEARYRALFQSTLLGVFMSTPDGRILECNRALADMLGYESVDAVIEAGAMSLYGRSEERARFLEALSERKELPLFEHTLRRADGVEVVVLETAVGIFGSDGELSEIHGFMVDVTQRKAVERSRDLYAEVFRQAAESIVITDAEGTILSVNEACERMTGYSVEEIIGENPRLWKGEHHDDAFYADLWDTIASGGVWTGRLINRRKDGAEIHVDATISPLRRADGTIDKFLSFQKDITREVELESRLHATERLESVGQLAAGIAHDFNNLITVVLTNAELGIADLGPDHGTTELLREVKAAALSGRALTDQLLAFGRRKTLRAEVVSPNDVVERVSQMLSRTLEAHIDLRVHLDPQAGNVRVDPAQLETVVLNLALNARDAMPNGGRLTIETSEVELDESYAETHHGTRPGRFVLLSVADTGDGMSEAVMDRIFEPFFTTKGRGKGTGLGLAMVYGTVKQSGGNIWVYSEPGIGTKFKVYLPRVAGTPEEKEEAVAMRSERAWGRLLVLEDDDAVRLGMRRILEAAGHQVTVADRPSVAFDALRDADDPFDILITDMVMPEMNGDRVASMAVAAQSGLRVLFVSGYAPEVAFGASEPDVPHAFLEKPFTKDELTGAVGELLATLEA